jgi:TonB family protein
MTHFMAYLVLISATIAAGAVLIELTLRTRVAAGRWVWIGALAAVIVATVVAAVAPRPVARLSELESTTTTSDVAATLLAGAAIPAQSPPIVVAADAVLPLAWPLISSLLLLVIGLGQHRLASERRKANRLQLNGQRVLLTENLGPAVAGIADPVVFVPRWVLALDEASRDLLLAHEFEHVKQRDTRLLLAGAAIAAVLPWNPVVWWMVRRLRLAVERDCDARVLAAHPNVRRYADLLLTAASRHGVSTRLLAAHFGEYHSDLEARIQTMTDRKLKWRPTLLAALVAMALMAVSCEAPRPEPLAPGAAQKSNPAFVSAADVLFELQVEKPVTLAAESESPSYPKILREAGVEGEVLASFVVDPSGQADASTFKVIRSTHELFSTAVRQAVPKMRFVAAEVGGKKVKQLVQQPFSFTLPGKNSTSSEELTSSNLVEGKKLAYTVRRQDALAQEPNVIVYTIDGRELARSEREANLLKKIEPKSIHSIEVFKPTSCPARMTCPLIKITLAKGRTLQR